MANLFSHQCIGPCPSNAAATRHGGKLICPAFRRVVAVYIERRTFPGLVPGFSGTIVFGINQKAGYLALILFHLNRKEEIMKRFFFFSILIAIILSLSPLAAETVTFVGLSPTPGIYQLLLKANLVKPNGDGPFPAVIMMHGCSRDTPYQDAWEKRFIQWGYAVLRVDSLTPRKNKHFATIPWLP